MILKISKIWIFAPAGAPPVMKINLKKRSTWRENINFFNRKKLFFVKRGSLFPQSFGPRTWPERISIYVVTCCQVAFFNCKTIGPKKIEPGRRGPKFRMNFLKIFHFLTFLELENWLRPTLNRPENAFKHSKSILCIILKLSSLWKFID